MAHIVAASDAGPRGDAEAPDEELLAFDNLILLCPTCHTIIDGSPEHYPVETVRGWKADHEGRLHALLGVQVYETRAEARARLMLWLAENRAVWELYGPDSPNSADLETAGSWQREVQEVVMPNNTRISALVEANVHLLSENEPAVFGLFEAHRRGLEARHLGVDVGVAAPRFPNAVENLFSE